MARNPNFKKIDITRAIEATRAGGLDVSRIEIDPSTGRIVIVTGTENATGNELDHWLKKQHAG